MTSPPTREEVMQFGHHIPGMLWPVEQGWLYDVIGIEHQSKRHLEVGSFCGRSTYVTAGGMCGGTITAVDDFCLQDMPGVPSGWCRQVFDLTARVAKNRLSVLVTLVDKPSVEAFLTIRDERPFDSVFIDACHHYAECKADIEMWSTMVKPGGLICGHDYWPKDSGVMDAVNETGPFSVAPNTRIWWRRI